MNDDISKTGLNDSDIVTIQKACQSFPEIEKAVVYGSRGRGDHKRFSDVDIALYGDFENSSRAVTSVFGTIEDSNFPYICDMIHYDSISNEKLKENIDRDGIVIYARIVMDSVI